MPRRPKFDDVQSKEIIRLYKTGLSAKLLAEQFSCSQETISRLLDRHGIEKHFQARERHVDGTVYQFSTDGKVDLPWLLDGPQWPTMDQRLRDRRYKGSL